MDDQRIREWIIFACKSNAVPALARRITFSFNKRLTTTAGFVYADGSNRIELASSLWVRASEEDKRFVVIHETCHLITGLLHPKAKSHGSEWQGTMLRCGVAPKRCHNIDTSHVKRRKYKRLAAACKCRTFQFTMRKINKMRRGEVAYVCRKCKSKVIELDEVGRRIETIIPKKVGVGWDKSNQFLKDKPSGNNL